MTTKSLERNLTKKQLDLLVKQVQFEISERHKKQDEEIAEKIEHDLLLAQAIHRGLESGYSILEIIEQILPDIEEPDSITH